MTLKNRCVHCDQVIEAPDSMRGHEMACPHCEATNVLLSAEDAKLAASQALAEEERARQRFMEELGRKKSARRPASASFAGLGPVHPEMSTLATRRLKDVSVYLVAFGYLLLVIGVGLGVGLAVWADLSTVWRVFAFGAGVFVAILQFVVLKSLSDALQAVADLSDLGRGIDERLAKLEAAASNGDTATTSPSLSRAH